MSWLQDGRSLRDANGSTNYSVDIENEKTLRDISYQFHNTESESCPKNYGSSSDSLARNSVALIASNFSEPYSSEISHPYSQSIFETKLIRSRCSEPNTNKITKFNENFSNTDFIKLRTSRVFSIEGNLPNRPQSSFFPKILSFDSETYSPTKALLSSQFMKLSADSPVFITPACSLTQAYFSNYLKQPLTSRSQSLIDNDQIIDVEYDSDIGWKTKCIRQNPFKRLPETLLTIDSGRGRSYSREYLKLDLTTVKTRISASSFQEPYKSLKEETIIEPLANSVKSMLVLTSEMPKDNSKEISKENIISKEKFDKKIEKAQINEMSQKNEKLKGKEFVKCRSSSNDIKSDGGSVSCDDEMIDEVFDSSLKIKSTKSNENKKLVVKPSDPITNCLEAMKPNTGIRSRNSSVRIKNNSDRKPCTNSRKLASSNAIANLQTKPHHGSLKKSSNEPSSSDYDRDRGRSRHIEGGHRDSFKKNDRTNDRGSDQDRDVSDREHKGGSLNRSLSNTDTNLEDRIGNSFFIKFTKIRISFR